ncbi:MAG: sugar phosphate isomerase/epimerase family protein [Planctomycetota bacterium]|nr:sugar phosphate isomerase/epimerase family protein [Planctomycetota bacterium]
MKEQSRRQFFTTASAAAFATTASLSLTAPAHAKDQPAKKKIPFNLGLASYTTRKFSLDDTLKMAARLGLSQICLKSFHLPLDASQEQIDEARKKAKAAGVAVYGCGVVYMKNEDAVKQAFKHAKMAGMKIIVGVPMPDTLPLVERLVKDTGIAVAIHNHGPGDKVYPTVEKAHEKIKGLDPRIGYCMDIGHTARAGRDPAATARRFAERMLDIHLKDVSMAAAKGRCVEAGRGVIDIPALLEALVETNFSGNASFEFEKDPADPMPGLAESVGYVRGALATL